jgi:hypothetical protein
MIQSSESPRTHFHIHWSGKEHLDWECFNTRADATMRALELAQPGESFRIDEIFEQCPLRGMKPPSTPTKNHAVN